MERRDPDGPGSRSARAAAPLADRTSAVELVDARRRGVLRATARRPDDLMVAELTLHNLRVVAGTPPRLRRVDPARDAILVLELPPQSFGEQAFLAATGPDETDADEKSRPQDEGDEDEPTTTPAEEIPPLAGTRIRMAGPSRLAFTMPEGVSSVPYTLDALLEACRTWPARRALTAVPEMRLGPALQRVDDLALLGTLARSADFAGARRDFLATLRDLGAPEVERDVAAAGQRVAEQAAAALAARDPARAMPLVTQRLRTEVDALGARTAALRDRAARHVMTIAVAQQAAASLAAMGLATRPGLERAPSVPLLELLLRPFRPGRDVTALELPYRLLTSPIGAARWTHRLDAAARNGRTELWHTRLTTSARDTGPDAPGRIRAIWSEDYPRPDVAQLIGSPFRMPLDAQDRRMLVQMTTGFTEPTVDPVEGPSETYRPRPANARRLVLSALGGLLDVDGAWDAPRPYDADVEGWRHLASLGRDHFVRVVYAGFLLPFGHAASLVKVTERKFEGLDDPDASTKRVAVLRQRYFLVVREPVRRLDGADHHSGGHPFPFTAVELLTRVTPNLLAPDDPACRVTERPGRPIYDDGTMNIRGGLTPRQAFWPRLSADDGGLFRFDVAAVDHDGERVTFSLPLLFMSEVANKARIGVGVGRSRPLVSNVIAAYNADAYRRARETSLGGATVCYAPLDAASEGDPRLPTDTMVFCAGAVAEQSETRVNAYPETEEASVALRAVQRLLGRADVRVPVRYAPVYAAQGFGGGNPSELFLELVEGYSPWKLEFGGNAQKVQTDALGAVASPSMGIAGVSRRVGPVGDLAAVLANSFDPLTFFADARLLGGIRIADVLGAVPLTGPGVPRLVTLERPAADGLPARVETRYDWATEITHPDQPLQLLIPKADPQQPTRLTMHAVTTAPVDAPEDTVTTATGTLDNFKIDLFGFIVLWFLELRFAAEHGRKPDVTVDLHPQEGVQFGGPLEFVNQLKDLLPGSGFSDPPEIAVTPSGIAASYSLGVPSVQVGVFALSNLSIGARFSLPFDTRPVEVGFNFAERHNPFSLTVSLLGGGGFFAIGVGADGVREIEAALEAGARLAIDLGVASGSVEVMAGIYFHWLTPDGGTGVVELSGYVRLRGELDVMGLISASLTFNLQLAYTKIEAEGEEKGRSLIWGEATLIVEIEVLVFSGEVTVRCRREFGGAEADPTFADLLPHASTWSSHCLAFAED
jgi:hypothetical protein